MKQAPLIPVALAIFLSSAVLAQQAGPLPLVIHPSAHDTSQPLRDIVASAPAEPPANPRVVPVRPTHPGPGPAGTPADPVLQGLPSLFHHSKPNLNVVGIGANGYAPPDTNGSVGASQYVQIVNIRYAVYNKSGGLILGPTLIHNIWSGFNGDCASGDGGDPVVVYDKAANRWVVSQLNVNYNAYCIAVSTGSDATGSYNRYEYGFGSYLPDYPKLGVWPDAYYFTANLFFNGSLFTGPAPCALDRSAMLNGNAAAMVCPTLSQAAANEASFLPSDLDGSTPPPAGSPNFYLTLWDSTTLHLYKFHADFATPSNSTFTGPISIPVASYGFACGGGTCIPQRSTTQQLDSLGERLMFRLAYRNFGDHEALVVNHSVAAGSAVGVRWYEIRSPNATPTVFQQGTFAPNDGNYRWMGSIGMDQSGDIGLGYSESGANQYPSVYRTGRVPSDPAGTMESEAVIQAGGGAQTGGLSRWGDYSSISIDPVDDCTFWYTNEFLPSSGSFNWSTAIGSFKFPSCGGGASGVSAALSTVSASPSSLVADGSTTSTITVTLKDGSGNPVSGKTVTLAQGTGHSTISAASGPSDANGVVTFTVKDAKAEAVTYTAQDTLDNVTITQTATVNFTAGPVSAATSTVTANPTSVVANNSSTSTITVTLNDANGNPVSGKTVTLAQVTGHSTISAASGLSNSSGVVTFTVKDATVEPVTYTATDTTDTPNVAITQTATVTFTAVPPPPDFSISASPTTLTISRGSSKSTTVTITDMNGSSSVNLSASGLGSRVSASFSPSSTVTGSGTATMTITVNRKASTTSGRTVTITGNNGSTTHSTTITLIIQ